MLRHRAIHPGEVLQCEFLAPLGMNARDLARLMGVPKATIEALIAGKCSLCVDLAIRLAEHLAMGERFWLGLQMDYDLEVALRARDEARGGQLDANTPASAYPQT